MLILYLEEVREGGIKMKKKLVAVLLGLSIAFGSYVTADTKAAPNDISPLSIERPDGIH